MTMHHAHDIRANALDQIHLTLDLSAGCDPDFDAGLDDLQHEFAELRVHFGNRE
jgi:hypothetical protein